MTYKKQQKVLCELKDTVSDFVSDLKYLFDKPCERGDLVTIEFFYKRLHAQQVMNNVVEKMIPHVSYIKDKNLDFFKKNTSIFSSLPDDRVSYYKKEILGDRFHTDDINMLWEYLDAIVAHAEVYLKTQ